MKTNQIIKNSFLGLAVLLLLSACSPNNNLTVDWKSDLEFTRTMMLEHEISLKNSLNRSEDFGQRMEEIIKNIDNYRNDDEVKIELHKALASIGQIHTKLDSGLENTLPFGLYMSDDRFYVSDTLMQYSDYLFAELIEINNRPVELIKEQLKDIVSVDNVQGLKVAIPSNMVRYSILHGLGILDSADQEASLSFRLGDGKDRTLSVPLVYQGDTSLTLIRPNADHFLYYKYGSRPYEHTFLADRNTLYIAYNSCQVDPEYSVEQFTSEIVDRIQAQPVEKIVIDLRNNRGGNSEVIHPLFSALAEIPEVNKHIVVLTSRYTASSAILNAIELRSDFDAVLIGEPPNGDPNKPGDIQIFKLPESGLEVNYSTKGFHLQEGSETALNPDIQIEPTIQDLKEGRDVVLNAALDL